MKVGTTFKIIVMSIQIIRIPIQRYPIAVSQLSTVKVIGDLLNTVICLCRGDRLRPLTPHYPPTTSLCTGIPIIQSFTNLFMYVLVHLLLLRYLHVPYIHSEMFSSKQIKWSYLIFQKEITHSKHIAGLVQPRLD